MSRVRAALAAAASGSLVVGCALAFAPGDHAGAPAAAVDASEEPTSPPPPPPGGAAGKHLLVIAGERDGADPAASDVWLAAVDGDGELSPFEPLAPGLFRGVPTSVTVAAGRLFVSLRAPPRRVQHRVFDPAVPAATWAGALAPAPPLTGSADVFSGTTLLALGGSSDGGLDDGVRASAFDAAAGSFAPLVPLATKLPVAVVDARVVTHGDWVYVFAGDGAGDAAGGDRVFVARRDAAGGLSAFAATTGLADGSGQPHTTAGAALCAGEGRVVVAGAGDAALASAVDEATGQLRAWTRLPALPGAVRSAGCAVVNGSVLVLGGIADGSRTGRILRGRIVAGGTVARWEPAATSLPAARSGVAAYVY
jgi:hypothetical protein